eukprot:gene9914-20614_t
MSFSASFYHTLSIEGRRRSIENDDTNGVDIDKYDCIIKAQFKKLGQKYHPDQLDHDEHMFNTIAQAYNGLKSRQDRINYKNYIALGIENSSTLMVCSPIELYNMCASVTIIEVKQVFGDFIVGKGGKIHAEGIKEFVKDYPDYKSAMEGKIKDFCKKYSADGFSWIDKIDDLGCGVSFSSPSLTPPSVDSAASCSTYVPITTPVPHVNSSSSSYHPVFYDMCYYHTVGTCRNGPSCKFKQPEICPFLDTCKAGIECEFKHPQKAIDFEFNSQNFLNARYKKNKFPLKLNHYDAQKAQDVRNNQELKSNHSDIIKYSDMGSEKSPDGDIDHNTKFNWKGKSGHIKILIIGGAGHGKSTFINSLHNYFYKKTLSEMEAVIPTKYLQPIEDSPCPTENSNPMRSTDSVTQRCTEYTFTRPYSRNTSVTFIDTPGLTDDTRCSAQDKINMYKILQHISESEHDEPITGIIMIMKGNQVKDISSMQTIAQKLKSIMTQNIINKIVTVFTNCRFKSICRAHSHIPFNIKESNSFYIDNPVFSVDVAAGLDLNRKKRAYEESWNQTMDEIGCILNTIFYQKLKNINSRNTGTDTSTVLQETKISAAVARATGTGTETMAMNEEKTAQQMPPTPSSRNVFAGLFETLTTNVRLKEAMDQILIDCTPEQLSYEYKELLINN